ncbi:sulfatase-like hydrolase/transferase [Robertmurraya massiliosenegalensis]|uniref:LTA synthase family protein n=1 Tax=Robertmurraya TaxID=2837507 RepID=UPI0039A41C38
MRKKTMAERTWTLPNKKFILVMLLLPLVIFISVEILHRGGLREGLRWIVVNPRESLYNYLLAFSFVNVLLVFTRTRVFFILASVMFFIFALLAQISFAKIDLRGEPLTILDFRLIGEATNIVQVLDFSYYVPILIVGMVLVIATILAFLFVRLEISNSLRFSVAAICLGLLIFANMENIDVLSKMKIGIPADVSWNHNENGFMLATLIDSKFLKIPEPMNYNRDQIVEIYNRMVNTEGNVSTGQKEKPNVIFIMSEAFWDAGETLDLSLNEEPLPHFQKLSEENGSGRIEVPGIGGGTANSEYEVLTGLSRRFLKDYSTPYNPYNSYIHRPIRSLATIFSEQNYSTTAMHTYHSWFYRRNEVYQHLGFDRFISFEGLEKKPEEEGLFASDKVVNELIIEELNRTPEQDFIHFVTMQGHGPYTDMTLTKNDIKVQQEMSDPSKQIVETYLNLMNSVDESLMELVRYLKDFQEPTLLVFYGDHLPALGNEVYEELGFNIYGEDGKKTPLLIWSNYSELDGQIELDANMLGAYVLNELGIEDPYMNYLYRFYKEASQLSENQESPMYDDFQLLQYDIMHGEQYFYQLVGQPETKEDYSVGYPLKLETAFVEEYANKYIVHLTGEGFGWMSSLYVNGNEVSLQTLHGSKATFIVSKEELAEEKPIELVVKVIDSREKVIKESNVLEYANIEELTSQESNGNVVQWSSRRLDGSLPWELFDSKSGYKIVRVNLELDEQLYFVENDGFVFTDRNADEFDERHLSDIYANGYLYLTIGDDESGWGKNVSEAEIRRFFDENSFMLKLAK